MIEKFFQSKVGEILQRIVNLGKVEQVRVLQANITAPVLELQEIRLPFWSFYREFVKTTVERPAIEVLYPDGTKKFMSWKPEDGTPPAVGTTLEFGKTVTFWPPPKIDTQNPH